MTQMEQNEGNGMSDYKPITGELRKVMNHTELRNVPLVELGEYEFARRCDEIDAIHAGLERENAELRERMAKMDNVGESMHGGITDELREYALGWDERNRVRCDLTVIADRIDAEHERQLEVLYRDMSDAEYVELPKDADGEYISVLDKLDGYGKTIEVVELRYGRSGWVIVSRDGNAYADTYAFTHHHAPTVEDVLREFALAVCKDDALTIRSGVVEEFAKRLRLAEVEDA